MGIIPLEFAQKITKNYQIKHSVESIKLGFIMNENTKLFYMG